MWKLAPMLVAVTACVQLFDLGDPHKDDRDGDHVPDSVDNCPDVPNPDQSDSDHDGIGDACDGCLVQGGPDSDGDGIPDACDGCDNRLPDSNGDGIPDECETAVGDPCPQCAPCAIGPHHDEDGDTIADGCDLCPAISDPTNADADRDGVGDACDPDSSLDHQQVFDAFFAPNQTWFTSGAWTIVNDQATVIEPVAVPPGVVAYRSLGTGAHAF